MKSIANSLVIAFFVVVSIASCSKVDVTDEINDQSSVSEEQVTKQGHDFRTVYLKQAGINVVSPSLHSSEGMEPYFSIGEDAVGAVTPMPEAEPFVAFISEGGHDVSKMQEGCNFSIEVEVKNESDSSAAPEVIKLSIDDKGSFMLPGSDIKERRVTIKMASDALNNYSCNVMLRKIL